MSVLPSQIGASNGGVQTGRKQPTGCSGMSSHFVLFASGRHFPCIGRKGNAPEIKSLSTVEPIGNTGDTCSMSIGLSLGPGQNTHRFTRKLELISGHVPTCAHKITVAPRLQLPPARAPAWR